MNLPRWLKKIVRLYDSDRRARIRIPAEYDAVLSGEFGAFPARGIDLHREGAAIRGERAVPLGARVFLHIPQLGLGGFAEVRRCFPESDGWHVIGLAFAEPLSRSRQEFQPHILPSPSPR